MSKENLYSSSAIARLARSRDVLFGSETPAINAVSYDTDAGVETHTRHPMDGITVTVAAPGVAPSFLHFVLQEEEALDRAIKAAASSSEKAYSLGRDIAAALDAADDAASGHAYVAGFNGSAMPTDEEIAHEDTVLAEISARPLTRDEPPAPDDGEVHDVSAPRPIFGGNRFPRKFNHEAARCLRREGVTVSALAKHFSVTEHTMSRVTKGVRRSKNTAAFSRLDALAMRSAGHPRVAIASQVGATTTALSAFFDRYDAVATVAREVA